MKVAVSIDHERIEWKEDILREIFKVKDMAAITSIRLSRVAVQNKLIWKYSVNGMFNVKSAYHMERRILGKEVPPMQQRRPLWKSM